MNQEQSRAIPVAIIIAGLIIGVAIYFRPASSPSQQQASPSQTKETKVKASAEAENLLKVGPNDYVLGNPKADITIVEFGDFQCPFCRRFFSTTEKELIEKYLKTGKAKFIWRDFAFLGQESLDAAQASRCAGEQGKFWEYHNYLFEKQNGENRGAFSVPNLKQFAGELGLNTAEFSTCLDSRKYLTAVEKETSLAKELGVNGTPTTFINGKMIVGALPFSSFESAIQDIIGKQTK